MPTSFESFVNTQLPLRPSAAVPVGGNFIPNLYMKTTGVGMQTIPDDPLGSISSSTASWSQARASLSSSSGNWIGFSAAHGNATFGKFPVFTGAGITVSQSTLSASQLISGSGISRIIVGTLRPSNPLSGDLWLDTSSYTGETLQQQLNFIASNTAGWYNTQISVSSYSGNWQNVYTNVNSNSANWTLGNQPLSSYSAGWQNLLPISASTASWQGSKTTLSSNSGNWSNAFNSIASVSSSTASWQNTTNVFACVTSSTASWENSKNRIAGMSGSTAGWQITNTVSASTATWQGTYSTVNSNSAAWSKTFQIGLVFPGSTWASASRTLVTPIIPYACTLNKIVFANYALTSQVGDLILQTNNNTINLSNTGSQLLNASWTSQSSCSASVSGQYSYVLNTNLALSAGQYIRGYVGTNRSIIDGQITLVCLAT